MKSFIFAHTTTNLPIMAYHFNNPGPRVLLLGGVHGDETEGVHCTLGLLNHFYTSFPYALDLYIVPQFNLDGILACTRGNARGIDLNRNLPSKDWDPIAAIPRYQPGPSPNSERENHGLIEWLKETPPELIITFHSWYPLINANGLGHPEAEEIAKHTGYRITQSIGYPTPGSLGNYAELDYSIPTITYEIQRGLSCDKILATHVPAVLEALKVTEKRFAKK